METNADILAARAALKAKMGGKANIGGKGVARRKHRAANTAVVADEKKLGGQMKRLGCNTIPGIEEVNMFTDDGNVLHMEQPKLQASLQANTFVLTGSSEKKPLGDMLPGIISQLGTDNLKSLQTLAKDAGKEKEDAEEEDIPELDGDANFEEVSKVD